MAHALVLGGTGVIGRAVAERLIKEDWSVTLTGRDPSHMPATVADGGGRFLRADRANPAELLSALGDGADLLVDCACYTAADARVLLALATHASSTVMFSSKAVYADAAGHHANSIIPPRFDGPISESQPTMPPSDIDYRSREGYGANKVAAEIVLLDSGLPISILRPSKVYGPGNRNPREWVFVKRILDHRPCVMLANRGAGVDHPSAAANVAALVARVAARPGQRVLNCADPDAPSGLEIARTIAGQLHHQWREVLLPEATSGLGRYPWNARYPLVLDTSAALALGYEPVGTYAVTVAAAIAWLVATSIPGALGADLPAPFDRDAFEGLFDYDAEDDLLARRSGGSGRHEHTAR
jgi:nucleoside-diphosphate-sugar epimerase